jgi:prolipoprotein diacylglyceryltransferase
MDNVHLEVGEYQEFGEESSVFWGKFRVKWTCEGARKRTGRGRVVGCYVWDHSLIRIVVEDMRKDSNL